MSYQSTVESTPGLVGLFTMGHEGNEPNLMGGNPAVPSAEGLTRVQPSLLPNGEGVCTLFDGVTSGFDIAAGAELQFGEPASLECWYSGINTGGEGIMIGLGTNQFQLSFRPDSKLAGGKEGVASWLFTTVPPTTPNVHHVLISVNGEGNRKIYIDGLPVAVELPAFSALTANLALRGIGHLPGGAFRYKGRMQFVAMYNVAVPAATVLQHYEAGVSTVQPVKVDTGYFYNSKKVS
jgi:hypothetical protein